MLYLLLTMFLCGEDQYFKKSIDQHTKIGEETPIFKGTIIKTKAYNKGGFLSFMDDKPQILGNIALVLTILVSITYICTLFTKGKHVLKLGLSLFTAGAISNEFDRIKKGHVIDYFKFKRLKNVVFNLGDMFIFLGAILIVARQITKKN